MLFFTEMWERFAYYGMRALLVLYMVQQLVYTTEDAGLVYGLYTGFVYLTPLIGGYLADKYFGQRRCIKTGAILMCIGLFLLALTKYFFPALVIMVIANGFFKANISSLLGLMYEETPEKKDSGFTIFYMGINLGAFFSPIVCGTLAIKFGFQWGFLSAGIGMLIGFLTYTLFEKKLLSGYGDKPIKKSRTENDYVEHELSKLERFRIYALLALMGFTIVFWMCYEQAGCSLTLFAEYATNRYVFGHSIPTEYFQSLNPLFIIALAPLFSMLWSKLAEKRLEPTSVEKFTIALGLMSIAYIVMAYAGDLSKTGDVSPLWLITTYFIMTIAELCISPIGLSLVTKLAPRQFVSALMGTWFLTSFFGNILAGFWGGKYGTTDTSLLFFLLAVISLISAVVLAVISPKLKKITGKI